MSRCLICGRDALREVPGLSRLPLISSDCRTVPGRAHLQVCSACATIQKSTDAAWRKRAARIYARYHAYYQAGGDEQIVLDAASGRWRRRSEVIVGRAAAAAPWPRTGRWLDVGCGGGATLRAVSGRWPRWRLDGLERSPEASPALRRIAGFERLHTGPLASARGPYDAVSFIHALEHFPAPRAALAAARVLLRPGGKVLVEVSDASQNPFDLLVADHAVHFTAETLMAAARAAGLGPRLCTTAWVPKELSLLASRGRSAPAAADPEAARAAEALARRHISWLSALTEKARCESRRARSFGLFGTSIAATWLAPQLQGRVRFFVDEDPSRTGRRHLGRPILAPAAVPRGALVYFALSPGLAPLLAARMPHGRFTASLPPSP